MVVIKKQKRGMGALNDEGEVESPKRQVLSKRNHRESSPLFQLSPLRMWGYNIVSLIVYKFRCTKVVIFLGLIDSNSQRLLRQSVKFSRLCFLCSLIVIGKISHLHFELRTKEQCSKSGIS
jgi:hypothetical protein